MNDWLVFPTVIVVKLTADRDNLVDRDFLLNEKKKITEAGFQILRIHFTDLARFYYIK